MTPATAQTPDPVMPEPSAPPRPTVRTRISRCVSAPWRLFQERTSVQLITGYVAVVLMVIMLFEITVVVAILWSPGSKLLTDQYTIDPYLGERSAAFIQWMDPDRVQVATVDGIAGDVARDELDRRLRQIADGTIPGLPRVASARDAADGVHAALIDTNGIVIATSDAWIPRGASIDDFPSASARRVAARNLALAGGRDSQWNALYTMEGSEGATTSAYPVFSSDGQRVGTFLLQGGSIADVLGDSRGEVARDISLGFLQSLWIFAIPALIVAIPFGFWRARAMSRRLQRLAGAAEAMSDGNLSTRVRVTRKDEIGRLAESFNDMAEQIDHNDRARRAFISNVSHELRTPVSIIQGTTERLLLRPEAHSPELEQPLNVIQHESQMLTRLIEDLFTIARIEEHNLRLVRAPLDMAGLATEIVEGVRDLAWTQQKISVESLVSPDLPPVLADHDRVRQIMNNLVYNALRHTPEGGLVIIHAAEKPDCVEIGISDTGVGIAPEKLESIFTRYYQVERSKRAGGGSGLGLAIVQQLVKAHGGEISVSSKVGQGTTFCFTLPHMR